MCGVEGVTKPHITKVPSPWELKVRKVYLWQFSIFLTFICAGIHAYKKPKVYPWYSHLQNPRFTLGTKAQGPPLVHILAKPKVRLGTYFYQTKGTALVHSHTTTTTITAKGRSSAKWPATPLLERLLIRSKPHLLLITIGGVLLKVKRAHHSIAW